MTAPGGRSKYHRVHTPISDTLLAQHIAGDVTLAAQLHTSGRAAAAAVDVDTGGESAVRAVLAAAEALRCAAAGFALDSGQHNGGHVWLFFDGEHDAGDLRALVRDILDMAGVNTREVYPSDADLRLPFGLHRWAGRRGALLVDSRATPIDIDHDPLNALRTFSRAYHETSAAIVAEAAARQAERRAALATSTPRPTSSGAGGTGLEVIRAFNQVTDLVKLLGGDPVHIYESGRVLMRCPCTDGHKNNDKNPSLWVWKGSRGAQDGKQLCGCMTPSCRLHNAPGQARDAFEAYCVINRIDRREAVRQLARPTPARPAARPAAPAPAAPAAPAPAPIGATPPAAPAPALRPSEARLLELYQQRQDWTNRELAELMDVHERTVKMARHRLVKKGLLARPEEPCVEGEITRSPPAPCIYMNHEQTPSLAREGGAIQITPPTTRNPLPKDPTARAIVARARRLEKLKAMSADELDRQYRVLKATAATKGNPRQRAALEYQAREVAELRARAALRRLDQLASDQADGPAPAPVELGGFTSRGEITSPPLPSHTPIVGRMNLNTERLLLMEEIQARDPSARVDRLSLNDLRARLRELQEVL